MTEILKGEFDAATMPTSGRTAQAAAVTPAVARKLRLEMLFIMLLLLAVVAGRLNTELNDKAGHPRQAVTGQLSEVNRNGLEHDSD
jgi:hypothetical protein